MLKLPFSKLLLVMLCLCSSRAAFAQGLMLAKIQGLSVPVLIPKNQNENGEQALLRYQSGISQTSMNDLWIEAPAHTEMQIQNEAPSFLGSKKYILIVANKTTDMQAGSARIENVGRLWREHGFEPVVLALGAGASLDQTERQQFNDRIAENFEVLMSLGGDDVDPKLYGQEKTYARYIHPLRDKLEFEVVKTFKEAARGMFVGICRGHQMGAIADGHTLYQDLVQDKVVATSHHEASKHPLAISPEMQRLTGIQRSMVTVNSIHHQAVKINPEAKSRSLGLSSDGVVEALEMKNGLGLSYQFHPEIMASIENTNRLDRYLGNKFFGALAKKMREVRTSRPLCRRLHVL